MSRAAGAMNADTTEPPTARGAVEAHRPFRRSVSRTASSHPKDGNASFGTRTPDHSLGQPSFGGPSIATRGDLDHFENAMPASSIASRRTPGRQHNDCSGHRHDRKPAANAVENCSTRFTGRRTPSHWTSLRPAQMTRLLPVERHSARAGERYTWRWNGHPPKLTHTGAAPCVRSDATHVRAAKRLHRLSRS